MPVQEVIDSPRLIRFGTFEVDCQAGELRKSGLKLKLSGQPFQVLALLLERPGDVVTREELQKRLWPDTFVDVEHNLNTAINKIREVLGDSAEQPQYVETLPRRGYRFIAPVSAANQSSRRKSAPSRSMGRALRLSLLTVLVGVAVSAGLVGLNVRGWRDKLFVRAPKPQIQALAVLPFENLSGDPGQEYVTEGITEALITELGKIDGPRVISRHSVMQLKGSKKALQEMARELNVDAFLEGTVQRSGNRVLVTAHLVQAFPDRQLWAGEFNRGAGDIMAVQSEIARSVASEVKAKLTAEDQNRLAISRPIDAEAHDEFLQGLYFENKSTELDLRTAVAHFERATAKDPAYAAAYAELAMSYFWLGHADNDGPPVTETGPPAKAAITRAVQLDPSLARTHLALALLATNEWNWPEAEREIQLAIKLNPNCGDCFFSYATLLIALGRTEEAISRNRTASELNPLDDSVRNQFALIAFTSRQYDLAIARFEKLHDSAWFGPFGASYAQKKMYPEAIAAMKRCETNFGHVLCLGGLARVYGLAGKKREAKKILDELIELSHYHYVYPTVIAEAYLGLDDKVQVLTWLERAYDEKDPWLFWLKVWPTYDPLRSEPRFQVLLRKLNFPE